MKDWSQTLESLLEKDRIWRRDVNPESCVTKKQNSYERWIGPVSLEIKGDSTEDNNDEEEDDMCLEIYVSLWEGMLWSILIFKRQIRHDLFVSKLKKHDRMFHKLNCDLSWIPFCRVYLASLCGWSAGHMHALCIFDWVASKYRFAKPAKFYHGLLRSWLICISLENAYHYLQYTKRHQMSLIACCLHQSPKKLAYFIILWIF